MLLDSSCVLNQASMGCLPEALLQIWNKILLHIRHACGSYWLGESKVSLSILPNRSKCLLSDADRDRWQRWPIGCGDHRGDGLWGSGKLEVMMAMANDVQFFLRWSCQWWCRSNKRLMVKVFWKPPRRHLWSCRGQPGWGLPCHWGMAGWSIEWIILFQHLFSHEDFIWSKN